MSVIIPYGARLNVVNDARCFGCGSVDNLDAMPLYKIHTQPGKDYIFNESELIPVCPKCREIVQRFFTIGKKRKTQKKGQEKANPL